MTTGGKDFSRARRLQRMLQDETSKYDGDQSKAEAAMDQELGDQWRVEIRLGIPEEVLDEETRSLYSGVASRLEADGRSSEEVRDRGVEGVSSDTRASRKSAILSRLLCKLKDALSL